MPKEQSPGKPTARRYSPEEKAAAVRMVRALRAELGTEQGTVHAGGPPARLRRRVGADPGCARPTSTTDMPPGCRPRSRARVKELEQENRELKRANVILGWVDCLGA